MTNEEKQLLTKDLCSRLDNHSLLVKYGEEDYNIIGISFGRVILVKPLMSMTSCSPLVEEVKPYLRPMKSMTLTEDCEFCRLFECDSVNVMFGYIHWTVGGCCDYDDFDIEFSKLAKVIDWLNEHCFDYRNLIEKGLALPAPEGMYH